MHVDELKQRQGLLLHRRPGWAVQKLLQSTFRGLSKSLSQFQGGLACSCPPPPIVFLFHTVSCSIIAELYSRDHFTTPVKTVATNTNIPRLPDQPPRPPRAPRSPLYSTPVFPRVVPHPQLQCAATVPNGLQPPYCTRLVPLEGYTLYIASLSPHRSKPSPRLPSRIPPHCQRTVNTSRVHTVQSPMSSPSPFCIFPQPLPSPPTSPFRHTFSSKYCTPRRYPAPQPRPSPPPSVPTSCTVQYHHNSLSSKSVPSVLASHRQPAHDGTPIPPRIPHLLYQSDLLFSLLSNHRGDKKVRASD